MEQAGYSTANHVRQTPLLILLSFVAHCESQIYVNKYIHSMCSDPAMQ